MSLPLFDLHVRVGTSMLCESRWDLLGEGNPSWVLLLGAVPMHKGRFMLWDGTAGTATAAALLLWWHCLEQSHLSCLGTAVSSIQPVPEQCWLWS